MPPLPAPPLGTPLKGATFSLNAAGVAGFFGGKEAISAMATVHLYKGRRWLGWYNSPGSYTVAKRFGRMANSRFWDGLFPGPNDSPAVSFGLDDKQGPKYIAALSGTTLQTWHLGYLTMVRSKETKPVEIPGRGTKACYVSYLAMSEVDYDTPVERQSFWHAIFAIFPIMFSVVACIMCALVYDWYSFSMIFLGIISSGLASYVIGEGRLVIRSVHTPAEGSPPGHGILIGEGGVVVIKGWERDVNAITKGHFFLKTDGQQDDEELGGERSYHAIGFSSLLLLVQFLLQLLLIPQGLLFGQIMFLSSLGVSWGYNSYLSSLEKEKIQTQMLFNKLGDPVMPRFRVGTRTTLGVLVCLLLFHKVRARSPQEERRCRVKILQSCLPNDTAVWERWREKVVNQLLHVDDESTSPPSSYGEDEAKSPPNLGEDDGAKSSPDLDGGDGAKPSPNLDEDDEIMSSPDLDGGDEAKSPPSLDEDGEAELPSDLDEDVQSMSFPYLEEDDEDQALFPSAEDRTLLRGLLGDAKSAFRGYFSIRTNLPRDSTRL